MIKKSLTLLLLLWLVACTPTNNSLSDADSIPIPAELATLLEEMTTDVRTLSDKDVTLQLLEEVIWGDGSLGCPDPEILYTMALVDGYKVIFTDGDHQFHYHTDSSSRYIYCENPEKRS